MNSELPQSSAIHRTAIITGGNSGLGYACARTLLEDSSGAPWNVLLACRDLTRGQEAVEQLRAEIVNGSPARVEVTRLDLVSLQSVREFAGKIRRRFDAGEVSPLHGLVCNAGVQSAGKKTFTADGFESTFGVNHLGHFLPVNLLLPRLVPPARIAVVASGVHDPIQKDRDACARMERSGRLGERATWRLGGARLREKGEPKELHHFQAC